ncbi:hypothetical protein CPB84DRAFT_829284 [Gymnopilus junonius]|uniref:Uncharacterized protein n=1 Tax=Gymnopilus junonius TaxID=109634 RepID=A0A9P5TEQ6_GYMJU|nr:hypothetical protein CPB84DRAFT_829284 [Gymnopilus junonius]
MSATTPLKPLRIPQVPDADPESESDSEEFVYQPSNDHHTVLTLDDDDDDDAVATFIYPTIVESLSTECQPESLEVASININAPVSDDLQPCDDAFAPAESLKDDYSFSVPEDNGCTTVFEAPIDSLDVADVEEKVISFEETSPIISSDPVIVQHLEDGAEAQEVAPVEEISSAGSPDFATAEPLEDVAEVEEQIVPVTEASPPVPQDLAAVEPLENKVGAEECIIPVDEALLTVPTDLATVEPLEESKHASEEVFAQGYADEVPISSPESSAEIEEQMKEYVPSLFQTGDASIVSFISDQPLETSRDDDDASVLETSIQEPIEEAMEEQVQDTPPAPPTNTELVEEVQDDDQEAESQLENGVMQAGQEIDSEAGNMKEKFQTTLAVPPFPDVLSGEVPEDKDFLAPHN